MEKRTPWFSASLVFMLLLCGYSVLFAQEPVIDWSLPKLPAPTDIDARPSSHPSPDRFPELKNMRRSTEALLEKEDFDELEAMAKKIKAVPYDIRDNAFDSSAHYWFHHGFIVGGQVFAPNEKWLARKAKLEAWNAAKPESLTAKIALADFYWFYAFKAQQNGDGGRAQNEQEQKERLAKAQAILNSVPEASVDDPEYYAVWFRVARDAALPKAKVKEYFIKAVTLAPECGELYNWAGDFLSIHGAEGEETRFAKAIAASFAAYPENIADELYADLIFLQTGVNLDRFRFDLFTNPKRQVDYERVLRGYRAKLQRVKTNPMSLRRAEIDFCALACLRGDKETARVLFLSRREFWAGAFGGEESFHRYFTESGAAEVLQKTTMLEKEGKIQEAEAAWLDALQPPQKFPDPPQSEYLFAFYMRQGMKEKVRMMLSPKYGIPVNEVLNADPSQIDRGRLLDQITYLPMLGEWQKAEASARTFDQKYPADWDGKNSLLLSALHRGDVAMAKEILQTLTNQNTNRPAYLAAQAVLKGEKPWEYAQTVLCNEKNHRPQAVLAIAFGALDRHDANTVQRVLEQGIKWENDEGNAETMKSLLYGVLSK